MRNRRAILEQDLARINTRVKELEEAVDYLEKESVIQFMTEGPH